MIHPSSVSLGGGERDRELPRVARAEFSDEVDVEVVDPEAEDEIGEGSTMDIEEE